MSQSNTVRVAAVQYHVGTDVEKNLATGLRMLDEAAKCQPDLIVMPEFANHLSWYHDKQHCYDVSVSLDGPFLKAIADKAKALGVYVVTNCTVQRPGNIATGSSLMYSPSGELVADNTKQIYIGHENDFLEKAAEPGPIIETPIGRLGFYACMDGVINETPRGLALRGAQVLCNSLNSFATDEGSLHIPVRAAENRVFVVAANKVGPLVPEEFVAAIAEQTGIPEVFLGGSGDSQIVAPDGTVLAHAKTKGEEVVYADIDPSLADDKRRPDGTDIFVSRRPALYGAIARNPKQLPRAEMSGAASAQASVVMLKHAGNCGLDEACQQVAALAADNHIIALPPLVLASEAEQPEAQLAFSEQAISRLAAVCEEAWVTTALVLKNSLGKPQYCAVLIGRDGLRLQQGQIHHSERFAWSALSDEIDTALLPFGRVALLTSDDSIYPEIYRLMAMAGVEVSAVALEPLQHWELETGLLERSAENRINLLVAPSNPNFGPGFITALQRDFTVLTQWQERPFDGLLSQPGWHRMAADKRVISAEIFPACAANKEVSRNTDLVDDRPWQLVEALVV